jgi:hypothetical protein
MHIQKRHHRNRCRDIELKVVPKPNQHVGLTMNMEVSPLIEGAGLPGLLLKKTPKAKKPYKTPIQMISMPVGQLALFVFRRCSARSRRRGYWAKRL